MVDLITYLEDNSGMVNLKWQVGNDSPVWFKNRRSVWFVYRKLTPNNVIQIAECKNGNYRYFKNKASADKLAKQLNDV